MAKRYMSDSEYEQQQYTWHHFHVDPSILSAIVDTNHQYHDDDSDELDKQRKQELKEKLWVIVLQRIEKTLTPRQQDAIRLFLMSKKQEHMGTILGVTQEAANVRLRLGLERLKKVCSKDKEIQQILNEIRGN